MEVSRDGVGCEEEKRLGTAIFFLQETLTHMCPHECLTASTSSDVRVRFDFFVHHPRSAMLTLGQRTPCGEFEYALHSGLRSRDGKLYNFDVSGSDGYKPPSQESRSKLTTYSYSPFPKPRSTHFLTPTDISWHLGTETCHPILNHRNLLTLPSGPGTRK